MSLGVTGGTILSLQVGVLDPLLQGRWVEEALVVVVDMEEVEEVVVALGVEEAVITAEAEAGEEEEEAVEEAELEMAEVEVEVEVETRTTVTEAALGKTEIRHNKLIIIVSVVMIKKCYA